MNINKWALVTKLGVALIGFLISADLLAQTAPAFVEWQQAVDSAAMPAGGAAW